jgi:hypothetical protein
LLLAGKETPGMGERVAGFEGVHESGMKEGIVAGYNFGRSLDAKQRRGFLAKTGYYKLGGADYYNAYLDHVTRRNCLSDMGIALRPTVIELLEEAARQEAERAEAEARKNKEIGHYM